MGTASDQDAFMKVQKGSMYAIWVELERIGISEANFSTCIIKCGILGLIY